MNNLYKLKNEMYIEANNEIWFANLQFNALVRIDKNSGQIRLLRKFPHYNVRHGWLYSMVYNAENELIFLPCNSDEIVIYNIDTDKFCSIVLDKNIVGNFKPYFGCAYCYRQYIYMFPIRAKIIVRYDIINHSVKYLSSELDDILSKYTKESVCFYKQFEILKNGIYLPFAELSAVAIFNPQDETLNIKYLDINGGCSTISYTNKNFYLSSWSSCDIYCWNPETDKIISYSDFPNSFVPGDYLFAYVYKLKDKLFYFPHRSNMVISLNVKTGEILEERQVKNGTVGTYLIQQEGNKINILMEDMESPYTVNIESKKTDWKPYVQLDNLYNNQQIADYLLKENYYECFVEEKESLNEYIEVLLDSENIKNIKSIDCSGNLIFTKIRY